MCDTFVALGNSTKDGSILFAKNSDRDPNEAHEIVIIPAGNHKPGSKVKCTYIEIPQVEQTFKVLLSKPFWIWGAEMGANEFGVIIGNEAVFTREPYRKEPGLIGMDFLRLALERSKTALAAIETIVSLLEKYGQSGNCGYAHSFFYHNSFLICDTKEAWVLETAGKEWAAEKVKDVRSISNGLTIESKWDNASAGLVQHAVEKGWCKTAEDFNFRRDYSDPLFTFFADARKRQTCTTSRMLDRKGDLTPLDMMNILRSHSTNTGEGYTPGKGLTGADVCMHAGFGPIRTSQSAGSMVSVINKEGITHWLTGTAAPCMSLFKPIWMDSGIPETVKTPGKMYDASVTWWKHEELHREIIKDYPNRISIIDSELREAQAKFVTQECNMRSKNEGKRVQFSAACFAETAKLEDDWLEKVKQIPLRSQNHFYYTLAWKELNKQAGMPGYTEDR
jgi:dipeptidase